MSKDLTLTVGPTPDGRRLAIISTGGHPQRPSSGPATVLHVEVIDGWDRKKLEDWFAQMKSERPWETRQ